MTTIVILIFAAAFIASLLIVSRASARSRRMPPAASSGGQPPARSAQRSAGCGPDDAGQPGPAPETPRSRPNPRCHHCTAPVDLASGRSRSYGPGANGRTWFCTPLCDRQHPRRVCERVCVPVFHRTGRWPT